MVGTITGPIKVKPIIYHCHLKASICLRWICLNSCSEVLVFNWQAYLVLNDFSCFHLTTRPLKNYFLKLDIHLLYSSFNLPWLRTSVANDKSVLAIIFLISFTVWQNSIWSKSIWTKSLRPYGFVISCCVVYNDCRLKKNIFKMSRRKFTVIHVS